jgi:hypothetical protein
MKIAEPLKKILQVFTKEYKEETEYREFMKNNIDKFKLGKKLKEQNIK